MASKASAAEEESITGQQQQAYQQAYQHTLDMWVMPEKNSCGAKLLSISCSRTVYFPAGSFRICK